MGRATNALNPQPLALMNVESRMAAARDTAYGFGLGDISRNTPLVLTIHNEDASLPG